MSDDESEWIETHQPDYRKPTMKELQDTDPMPFGQHRNTPMQDVPAKYLHYLHTTGIQQDTQPDRKQVADYIRRNLSALQQEYKDGIW